MSPLNNTPERKGPWIHIIHAAKEAGISTDQLLNLIQYNEIAFIKPKVPGESKVYLHRRWVNALKARFPIAKYCMLQCHLRMEEYTEEEWKRRISSKKPKQLATDEQKNALMQILKSDFIMLGEEKWILPIFKEKWLGHMRMVFLLEYFLGVDMRDLNNKSMYQEKGVIELRRQGLVKLHENRIIEPIDPNDWLPEE